MPFWLRTSCCPHHFIWWAMEIVRVLYGVWDSSTTDFHLATSEVCTAPGAWSDISDLFPELAIHYSRTWPTSQMCGSRSNDLLQAHETSSQNLQAALTNCNEHAPCRNHAFMTSRHSGNRTGNTGTEPNLQRSRNNCKWIRHKNRYSPTIAKNNSDSIEAHVKNMARNTGVRVTSWLLLVNIRKMQGRGHMAHAYLCIIVTVVVLQWCIIIHPYGADL